MSQGKLNAIPPGTGGIVGQARSAGVGDQIAQQGMASAQQTPPIGTLPGTFGRPGGLVQQPQLGQFDGIGATAPATPMPMPGGEISTMENKYPMPMSGGIKQFGGFDPINISAVLTPDMMSRYTGVNTPAPEDELDALPGPDSQMSGGGY
jgi:hypothetical protein